MDKLDKHIKTIKLARMKPHEKYIYNIFSDMEFYKTNKKPDFIVYKKNGETYFEYYVDKNSFYVHKIEIWFTLSREYNMKDTDISELLANFVKNFYKINVDRVAGGSSTIRYGDVTKIKLK